MSKQTIKKFRKNDWNDDEEFSDNPRNRINKRLEKRVDRALRTKDISALIEDDYIDEFEDWPDEDDRR
jgi:SOS response regulatory protein OraA/RecX